MSDLAQWIAAAREKLATATDGKWEAAECGPSGEIPEVIVNYPDGDWLPICYFTDARGDGRADNVEGNRPVIVLAVNALPALLDVVEAVVERSVAEGAYAVEGDGGGPAAWRLFRAKTALDAALARLAEVRP